MEYKHEKEIIASLKVMETLKKTLYEELEQAILWWEGLSKERKMMHIMNMHIFVVLGDEFVKAKKPNL